jgi:tetratricopeptide (TPR) repeat protein
MSLRAFAPLIASVALVGTISGAFGQGLAHRCSQAPKTANVHRAVELVIQGRYREAVDLCNKLFGTSQDSSNLYVVRSNALSYLGQNDKAVDDCTNAIGLNQNCLEAYLSRSDCYNLLGQPAKAIADCNKGLELDPTNGSFYCNRGEAEFKLLRYEEAMSDLRRANELIPSLGEAYYFRGLVYQKNGSKMNAAPYCLAKSKQLGYQPGRASLSDGLHVIRP